MAELRAKQKMFARTMARIARIKAKLGCYILPLFLIVFTCSGFKNPPASLKEEDVRSVMERLFAFHIESRELNPAIIKRCLKLYIEQFDSEKTYLLEEEVRPYFEMGEKELTLIAKRMEQEDFSDFLELNQKFQNAILRGRELRKSVTADLQHQGAMPEISSTSTPVHYAKSAEELAQRQYRRFTRFFLYHHIRSGLNTPEQKEKAYALFEKKVRRMEGQYLYVDGEGKELALEQAEHLFALRILKAFAKSLDTHTAFFSPEEAQEMRLSLEKKFEGVGVILAEGIDGIVIADLVKGSPAHECGQIRANDQLIKIGDVSVETSSFEEVLDALKKRDKGEVILGFRRKEEGGVREFKISLKKQPIMMNEDRIETGWEKCEGGIIGTITLHSFYENSEGMSSEKDIKEAISAFEKIAPLQGLVLDLRENAGGFLSQAVKVASLFISNGVIVISKYGKGEVHYLRNVVGRSFFKGPLVILTSKVSASASEVVAQALQDYGVGLIVGDERTFGKGSIQYQTVTDAKADLFFKVTVGKYYTASGKTTQIEGVLADIVLPTRYAPYHIGERYLEYPLAADRIEPAFIDPLSDLDERTKRLFQNYYLPHLQRVVSSWKRMVPSLKERSQARLEKNEEFQALLKKQDEIRGRQKLSLANSVDELATGGSDLQMKEAVNIVKDMIELESQAKPLFSHCKDLLPTGSDS